MTDEPLNAGDAFAQLARDHGCTVHAVDPDAEANLLAAGHRILKIKSPPGQRLPDVILIDGVEFWPDGAGK